MLQILGDKLKGMVTWTIVLVIVIVFVFLGLNDYFSLSDQSTVAKVGSQKITRKMLDELYGRVAAQQEVASPNIDAVIKQLMHFLIRRTAVLLRVQDLGFELGDAQIAQILANMPAFQVDGRFSKDQYQKILTQSTYTDASFRKELVENAIIEQFEKGVLQSSFATFEACKSIMALVEQKRDVGYLKVPANHYRKMITISEQAISDFYDKNKQTLISPEQVSLEYLRLSLDHFMKKVSLSKEEVSNYYQEHQSDYTLPERVHARHLLIKVPAGSEPTVAAQALVRVEGFLKQLKEGADFRALARRWSEDAGSANKDGDLGWMTRGQMVPAFEEAAFRLKPGAYSEAIRTDFGYHIIQVVDHKASEVRAEAAVALAIREQLKFQKAQEQFAKATESLTTLALEQQDSVALSPIAAALGVAVQHTPLFSSDGGEGLISDPMIRKVAFSEAFLKQGFSTQPVLLSDQSVLVMRLTQHNPAKQQTLAEAHKRVYAQLMDAALKARLQAFADSFVKRVQGFENPAAIAKEQGLVWSTAKNVSRRAGADNEILSAAFQLSPLEPGEKLKVGKFILTDGSYGLVALYKVTPGQWSSLSAAAQQDYYQTLSDISGQMEYMSMVGSILGSTKIQFFEGNVPK